MAGVDVVREQVQAGLTGSGLSYDIETQGLVLRTEPRAADEMVYPLYDSVQLDLRRPAKDVKVRPLVPPIDQLIFGRISIWWDAWVRAWVREAKGEAPELLPQGLVLVPGASREMAAREIEERNGDEAKLEAVPTPGVGSL